MKLKLKGFEDFDADIAFKEMLLYSGNPEVVDLKGLELFLCAKGYTPE